MSEEKVIEDFFKTISNIIKTEFKESFSGSEVILKDSTSKEVKIKKTGKFLSLQLDKKNKSIFPFFNCSIENVCKVADRILICSNKEKNSIFVFIVELKSGNIEGVLKQVRASYFLSQYICSIAKNLLNNPNITINYRGLIFSHNRNIIGTSKPNNLQYNTDTFTELKFKHLQSGLDYQIDSLTY